MQIRQNVPKPSSTRLPGSGTEAAVAVNVAGPALVRLNPPSDVAKVRSDRIKAVSVTGPNAVERSYAEIVGVMEARIVPPCVILPMPTAGNGWFT